jgi:uncharacterized protein YidB (DUF937 family)
VGESARTVYCELVAESEKAGVFLKRESLTGNGQSGWLSDSVSDAANGDGSRRLLDRLAARHSS